MMYLRSFRDAADAALRQQLVEAGAVDVVERLPRRLAAPDLLQRWLVEGAPGIGEGGPINSGKVIGATKLLALANDAGAPIDYGAEHIEEQSFDGVCH